MQKDPLDHEKKMLKALEFLFIRKGCGVFQSGSSYQGIYIQYGISFDIPTNKQKQGENIYTIET